MTKVRSAWPSSNSSFCSKSWKPRLVATTLYDLSCGMSTASGSDGTGRRSLPLTSTTRAPSALRPGLIVASPFFTLRFGSKVSI